MKRYFIFALFLFFGLLSGCKPAAESSPTPISVPADATTTAIEPTSTAVAEVPSVPVATESPADPTSNEFEWIFDTPPDPINLSISVAEDSAVEALIPISGGSLSAVGGDGTRFNLEIPDNALLNDTTIRMTPVTALSGIPWGDGSGLAVRLEPEGLAFNDFVTLTIEPAVEIPIDQQIFFGFDGQDNNLSLALPVVDSAAIQLQLLHFSGYGVSKGLLADTEPVRQRIGGRDEARLQSLAAVSLQGARIRAQLGIPEPEGRGVGEQLLPLFAEWEEKVVKPREAAAGESCAAGRLALQTRLGFERQKQLLGMGDAGSMGNLSDLMLTAGRVCLQEEFELCRDDHIIHRMIPVWLGFERQMQLLGFSAEGQESALGAEARQLTEKCLRFDLVFESTGVFDDEGDGYTSVVRSTIPLKFDSGAIKISGQSALINDSFEFVVSDCTVTSNRGGGTFDVLGLAYKADTSTPNDPVGHVTDFTLSYYPGQSSESFTVKCEDSSFSSPPGPYWSGVFWVTHAGELSLAAGGGNPIPDPAAILGGGPLPDFGSDAGGFIAEDWEIFGDEYFAKKEWTREDAGLGLVEVGTFKLYHRPGN